MESHFLGADGASPSEASVARPSVPRVLLIEDNPGDIVLFKHYLGEDVVRQIELRTAGSISEAEKLLATEVVDAIILDLRLPDADGVEAIRRIRRFRQNVPLIILSGNLDTSMTPDVVGAGADSFYSKEKVPVDSLLLSLKLSIDRSKNQTNSTDSGVDEETGLFNQYGFQNVVEEAFRLACASDCDLCLLWVSMIPCAGGLASLDCIKELAAQLEKSIRSTDYIARFEHSDFLIAMPGVGPEHGEQIRDRLHQVVTADLDPGLEIHVGAASLEPSISTLTTLIVQAKNNANVPKTEHS